MIICPANIFTIEVVITRLLVRIGASQFAFHSYISCVSFETLFKKIFCTTAQARSCREAEGKKYTKNYLTFINCYQKGI